MPTNTPKNPCHWCGSDYLCDCEKRIHCAMAGEVGHETCGIRQCGCPKFVVCQHPKHFANTPHYTKTDLAELAKRMPAFHQEMLEAKHDYHIADALRDQFKKEAESAHEQANKLYEKVVWLEGELAKEKEKVSTLLGQAAAYSKTIYDLEIKQVSQNMQFAGMTKQIAADGSALRYLQGLYERTKASRMRWFNRWKTLTTSLENNKALLSGKVTEANLKSAVQLATTGQCGCSDPDCIHSKLRALAAKV